MARLYKSGGSAGPRPAQASVAEVVELQRQLELAGLEHGNGVLQVVALLALHAQLVAVDLAFHLQLGVLQCSGDLLGDLLLDALLDGDLLPGLGQVGLDVAEFQAEHVDAARGQAGAQRPPPPRNCPLPRPRHRRTTAGRSTAGQSPQATAATAARRCKP
ncbi:hypothetical protein G6F68_010500 [Rhizopus microsporus]|nr:hypothetical protein G6F68_010500 [Rhizopus microsporus]